MGILLLPAELVVEPATDISASAMNGGRGAKVRWRELTNAFGSGG